MGRKKKDQKERDGNRGSRIYKKKRRKKGVREEDVGKNEGRRDTQIVLKRKTARETS